jgi:4-aminobutyrate aminotransferase-like enzyme
MKESGILLSTDGPFHNVIKIKPPLVFSKTNADSVIERLDSICRESFIKYC